MIFPAIAKATNASAFTATTVAPVGRSKWNAARKPIKKQSADTAAEESTTPRNERNTRMEVSDGKMSREEMRMTPSRRMPTTTVTAVSSATTVL